MRLPFKPSRPILGSFVAALVIGCGTGREAAESPSDPLAATPLDEPADGGACTSLTLTPSVASPQLVGASIVFTASAECSGARPKYEFRLRSEGASDVVVQASSEVSTWTWNTSSEVDTRYTVEVIAHVPGGEARAAVPYRLRRSGTLDVTVSSGSYETPASRVSGSAIDCFAGNTGTCSATLAVGSVVELSATPGVAGGIECFTFAGWGGACASAGTSATCTVSLEEHTDITATFTPSAECDSRVTVNADGSGGVEVTPPSGPYFYGTTVTLTATPSTGWGFGGWSDMGPCLDQNPCVIGIGDEPEGAGFDYTVEAVFVKAP